MPRVLKANPFRPGKPITDPELFAGRREELSLLVDALYQTGTGNARHIIVTGARGIGKSSLVNQDRSSCTRRSRYSERTRY